MRHSTDHPFFNFYYLTKRKKEKEIKGTNYLEGKES